MSYGKTNCAGKTKHARILSFLSGQEESEYADQSGEITGILKEMCDEMSKQLTTGTDEETTALKDYEELAAAKKKEINALTASIELKAQRIGELAVSIVHMKNITEHGRELRLHISLGHTE